MLWALVTGEYPPAPGGVSDYTRLIAQELVRAGDEVHVWAPTCGAEELPDLGVQVHRLSRGFDPVGVSQLDRELRRLHPSRRVLLQYVPHAFGLKGMNLPLCGWLASGRARHLDVMFHEVAYPWQLSRRPAEQLLAAVQRVMSALAGHAAERVFVSCQAWNRPLAQLGVRTTTWLPIASTLPEAVDGDAVRNLRSKLLGAACRSLIGHFGTYSPLITELLVPILKAALKKPSCAVLLLGRGSSHFLAQAPFTIEEKKRIVSLGELEPTELVHHLAACDLVVQPYPDGISARRTSALAALALGVPVLSNDGPLSETLWRDTAAVALGSSPAACAPELERLLQDAALREKVGRTGRATYERYFAAAHAVERLRELQGSTTDALWSARNEEAHCA